MHVAFVNRNPTWFWANIKNVPSIGDPDSMRYGIQSDLYVHTPSRVVNYRP